MRTFTGLLGLRRLLLLAGVCLVLGLATTVRAAETRPAAVKDQPALSLGFFPIISTVALYKRFAPLRDYLSDKLGRPVNLATAKDFPTFLKRTDTRNYDIVVTAPHFALRAADSGKYRIRAALQGDVHQLLVVRSDSPISKMEQLAGKRIASPPEDALMTMIGKAFLTRAGLKGARAPIYHAYISHNAANEALLAGEADAAIASSNVIKKAMGEGARFKIIARSFKLPNMATLVATELDKELGDRVVQILVSMKSEPQGREVLKQIRFPGYRAVDSAREYESMRPYLEQAVREMAELGFNTPR